MNIRNELEESGFAVVEPGLEPAAVDRLLQSLQPIDRAQSAGRAGARHILRRVPEVRGILGHPALARVVKAALGPKAFAVKGILFDKNPGTSWTAPWHQDLTVAVQTQAEAVGYGPWSIKAGVPHVQPPVEVLEQMLAVRIHLDECGVANGALHVLAGSHRHGQITGKSILAARERYREVVCPVSRGGFLVMRPLLLHSSLIAETPTRRRVLHLEFAACELASQVTWFERWPCAA
ncbi:MAG TPA: phytanoyl-CoA dioxygenase family protein [Candidatus Polarisedimenticolia bacterium]|nr:phytanoyl-CoA dioxygenase family protein [Candidatus Polarisedimenticolia bacterium]